MKLVAGLGNPGREYAQTRHNVGFMVLDRLAAQNGDPSWQSSHQGLVTQIALGAGRVDRLLLLKPMTYMNLSGRSVASAMKFYRLTLADLLIVVDDVALPGGTLRLKSTGSSGGHNGLGNIELMLSSQAGEEGKTGRDYTRLRIGIDPPGRVPLEAYVLEPFSAPQKDVMENALSRAVDAVKCWAMEGLTSAMGRFNVEGPGLRNSR